MDSAMVLSVVNFIFLLALQAECSKHLRIEPAGDLFAFFTGESFFMTCIPDPDSGATRIAWQTPAGRDITHTRGRVHVEPSAHNLLGLELVVEEVRHKDQGTFTCSAIVDGRDTRVYFNLKVYQSLTFWDTPDVQVGREGTDFMVSCHVRADPHPIVSWYVNDTIVLDDSRHTILDDGLLVKGLATADAGNYTCRAFVVTPHKSQIQDRHIALHVHYKPYWHHEEFHTFYSALGQTGNLTCESFAEPPPTFEWFKGRALLGNNKVYRIINGKYISILQVKVKNHANLGAYLCLVSNTVGEIQKEVNLLEGVPPNTPNFTLSSEEPGILTLKIFPSPLDSLPLKGYKIQWKRIAEPWKNSREYLTSTGTDFLIQDLHFDTEYAVRVSAVNDLGYSDFTETLVQRTKALVAETVVDSIMSSTYSGARRISAALNLYIASVIVSVALLIARAVSSSLS